MGAPERGELAGRWVGADVLGIGTPVLGFEPRSEAPQASRIIHCSGTGWFRPRSYPTRARDLPPSAYGERGGLGIKIPASACELRATLNTGERPRPELREANEPRRV
jgi:hypothetical protein